MVVNVGDVNGDGFEDILVGAAQEKGGAALYLGGPGADSVPDLVLPEQADPTLSRAFGFGVAGGGDVNGDGYSDFAVSDPYSIGWYGAVYVYFGGRVPDGEPDLILRDPSGTTSQFGPSVSLNSDFNGDAIADVLLGSPGWESFGEPCGGELPEPCGEASHGRAYIYFGGPGLRDTPDLVLGQPKPWRADGVWSHAFGSTVASAGDVNGDHVQDILVAEPGQFGVPESWPYGRAILFLGSTSPDSIPDQFLNMLPGGFAGLEAISSAGDFNADGFGDIVVSGPFLYDNGNGLRLGRPYVYFGSSPLKPDHSNPDLTLGDTPDVASLFVHGGRDLDGDGITDIMAGVPGKTLIYLGAAHPDGSQDMTIECGTPRDEGAPLAAADWNGDGVADPIVGSGHSAPTGPGVVYIFDTSTPLPGRAFARGGPRTVPLARPGTLALHFQPVGGSYENSAVDPSTLRLVSTGTGDISEIAPVPDKTMLELDSDRDGIPELIVSFRAEDVRRLFSSLRGRQEVEAAIEGRLLNRRRFQAPATLTIVGTGGLEDRPARLAPNPLNPQGTLDFTIVAPGSVSLRLYDVAGRCVRTVLRSEPYEGGTHRVPIAARDDRGVALPSGVYFYRLELPAGVQRGRFVVAK
ncbi:MAG TPA: FG-GAP-like repeat-containing protein [Candidatus Eisenbacteria bacterium]|nr:FG-GAP-like repeat-containing protein [Candidatus Eisenbacteria bacterium]